MKLRLVTIAICSLMTSMVSADDFTTSLDNARQAYEKGDMDLAREELGIATQFLGQIRAKNLQKLLPEALPGWKRELGESDSNAGLAMMGGGTTASASYSKGDQDVSINIVADSPMIASMAMIFSNPAIGGKQGQIKRLAGQKAMVNGEGEITALVDNRVMVTVDGNATAADREAYFSAINFKSLKSF